MKVIPAIDLSQGRLVRLVRGERGGERVYGDPMEWLERLLGAGARLIHIVDLDAAQGLGGNRDVVRRLVERASEAGAAAQVGGGLRSLEDALEAASWGDVRVILGTIVYIDPPLARAVLARLGAGRVVAALDARRGRVALAGWTRLGSPLGEAAGLLEALGFRYVLYTSVERDGTLSGAAAPPTWLAERFSVIAAGGVSSLGDLEELARRGVYGAVVGRALLEGRIPLEELESVGWEL